MADPNENIPHPTLEVYRHTLLRGANAGSFLTILCAPPILYARGTRDAKQILQQTAWASVYGMAIGAGLSAAATFFRLHSSTDEQVYDRAYRLRCNKGQNHMDIVTYSVVGAGSAVGVMANPMIGAVLGGSMGFGASVVADMLIKKLRGFNQ